MKSENIISLSDGFEVQPGWQESVPLDNKQVASKGMLFVFGFLGIFLIWALLFPIASAVVASGKIVSAGQNKLIQHPSGGVVREIRVADGAKVTKNQILVVLDPASSQAELTRLSTRSTMLSALRARLEAEQGGEGFTRLVTVSGLQLRGGQGAVSANPVKTDNELIIDEQRKEYDAGRKRLTAELDAANFQIESLKDQRSGFQTRLAGERQLLRYTQMELKKVRPLVADGFLAKNRLWDLDKKRLEQITAIGNLEAEIDSTGQRVAEAEARFEQLNEADQEKRSEELTRVIGELGEISGQLNAAKSAVTLTELRAPQAGTIVNLAAHTRGGVVQPGAVIAEIVPTNSGLETEFRVALADIKAVKVGQKARVVVTAFNRRTYDPIEGQVTYVSADSAVDEQSGDTYFLARASLNAVPEKNTGLKEIQAGMATEVYALAEPRVFMSYALQPIFDSFSKAFREAN